MYSSRYKYCFFTSLVEACEGSIKLNKFCSIFLLSHTCVIVTFTCSFSFYWYIVQLGSGCRCPLANIVINFLFRKSRTDEAAATFSKSAIVYFSIMTNYFQQ